MSPANQKLSEAVAPPPLVPVTSRGEATRRKLLAAAEVEFGEKGFHAASVSSITQRADVGQGTFYLYFRAKEEVFSVLVRDLASEQRQVLVSAVAEAAGLPQAERRLLRALMQLVASQPGRYRILREAQFVDEPIFRESQEGLLTAVASTLAILSRGALDKVAIETRVAALVGAAEQVALWQCHWGGKPLTDDLLDEVLRSPVVG